MKTRTKILQKSSGNVFKDLGFPNSEEMLAKAALATQINAILQEQNLTQKEVAKLLSISQPNVSLLSRGILEGFSLERLIKFLNQLNQDIEIVVRKKPITAQENKKVALYGHLKVVYA
ncbi:MAG: helix-turn-helix transcriptional regulator [Gammaproteobacteria bacterium]